MNEQQPTVVKAHELRLWARWRQIQYIVGISIAVAILSFSTYRVFFYAPPTCFDGKANGLELNVDCGGECSLMCVATVTPPKVQWVQSFKISEGSYNAVAYIENSNAEVGTPAFTYTLTLHDDAGVIDSRTGTVQLPPYGVYPIFEGAIRTGGRIPTRTTLDAAMPSEWYKAETTGTDFAVLRRQLVGAGDSPRVISEVQNNLYTETKNLRVVATIFNSSRIPLTASQTIIPIVPERATVPAIFTWPEPIATTVRSCIVPTDIALLLDRSGSMAADGGKPPEPLESAKKASEAFVMTLKEKDQASFISYATRAVVDSALSNDFSAISEAVLAVQLGKDGIQYTNMGDAFGQAVAELTSERHNPDARQVLVLMTDGDVTRPLNPDGKEDIAYATEVARKAAAAAKSLGITVITIGFGKAFDNSVSGVVRNLDLIKEMASTPAHTYTAPTASELVGVYSDISASLCEDGAAIIDIVAVPEVVFVK